MGPAPPFRLAELIPALEGRPLIPLRGEETFAGFTTDTRTLRRGEIFIPVKGRRDGHQFLPQAVEKGAAALLVERGNPYAEELLAGPARETLPPIIEVEFTQQALYRLASWYRDQFQVEVIAITGSVGKTTTKEFLAELLSRRGKVLKSQKSYNNELGVPLTIARLTPEHDYLVLEMGMRGLGEIRLLSALAKPDHALITTVRESHIGRLGDPRALARAKAEVVAGLRGGYLALPTGPNFILEPAERELEASVERERPPQGFRLVRFGSGAKASYRLENYLPRGLEGSSLVIRAEDERVAVELPLPGSAAAMNLLAAVSIAHSLGIPLVEIAERASRFRPVPQRLEVKRLPGPLTLIDDSYNASFVSTREALKVLKQAEGSLRIAILGDMLELGELSDRAHQVIGELAADLGIDWLITVGYYSSVTANRFGEHNPQVMSFNVPVPYEEAEDPENWIPEQTLIELRPVLADLLRPGAVVLVKGSRALRLERVVEMIEAQARSRWAERPEG